MRQCLCVGILVLAFNAIPAFAAEYTPLPQGPYGGENGPLLSVGTNGASLDLGCSRVQINTAIKLDEQGNFDVPAEYIQGSGVFLPPELIPPPTGAIVSGSLQGHVLSVTITTVTRNEDGTWAPHSQSYQLTFGRSPSFPHCA
jgi:hypothetical protein